jgi:hypothetical protein
MGPPSLGGSEISAFFFLNKDEKVDLADVTGRGDFSSALGLSG